MPEVGRGSFGEGRSVAGDVEPSELKSALDSVVRKGFYYSDMVSAKLVHTINTLDEPEYRMRHLLTLNERELEFMKLVCTEWFRN